MLGSLGKRLDNYLTIVKVYKGIYYLQYYIVTHSYFIAAHSYDCARNPAMYMYIGFILSNMTTCAAL